MRLKELKHAILDKKYAAEVAKGSLDFDLRIKNVDTNECKFKFGNIPRNISPRLVINAFGQMLQAVNQGLGIAVIPTHVLDRSFFKDKVSSEGGVIAWITLLAIAGFTPVPFKLLTITSGFVNFNIIYFILISIITRGSRFFIIAFLIGNFGPTMKKIIEKRLLSISILISLIVIIIAYLVYKFLLNFSN